MKKFNYRFLLASILITLSVVIYLATYLLYRDGTNILENMLLQLAFVPIFYLISTLIIDRFMVRREFEQKARKLNMLIGLFFNELGSKLIESLSGFDEEFDLLRQKMVVSGTWTVKEYKAAEKVLKDCKHDMNSCNGELEPLQSFLMQKRAFMVNMMENQNLQEHETFTELVLAIFHLCNELEHRENLRNLPEADYDHLSVDMKRAYSLLLVEWLRYMQRLEIEYPYQFSMAVRMNPFLAEKTIYFK